jgi:hypothetical protein
MTFEVTLVVQNLISHLDGNIYSAVLDPEITSLSYQITYVKPEDRTKLVMELNSGFTYIRQATAVKLFTPHGGLKLFVSCILL